MRDENLARHAFHRRCLRRSLDFPGTTNTVAGFATESKLDRVLEESEKLWIVPADVHF